MNNLDFKPKGRKNSPKFLTQFGFHLVYAEGEKTEPLFVVNIKEKISKNAKWKNSAINIEVISESGGLNTLTLLEYAEKDVKQRLDKKQKINYVWIFYDKDSFSKDSFNNTFIKMNTKNVEKNDDGDYCDINGVRWVPCWSNECFEIWPLLHFGRMESALSRNLYIPKINEFLKRFGCKEEYSKNCKYIYTLLSDYGNVANAIKFAKDLDLKLTDPNIKENPSTGVYQFVEYFIKYLENS
jgi:hypothetical protein